MLLSGVRRGLRYGDMRAAVQQRDAGQAWRTERQLRRKGDVRAALTGSPTVRIYGDGTQRRDFVHIDDVVRGVCCSIGKVAMPEG